MGDGVAQITYGESGMGSVAKHPQVAYFPSGRRIKPDVYFCEKIIAGQRFCSQTTGFAWKILGTRGSGVKCFDVGSEMFHRKPLKS